ncbi:helix-turn-helix domain-containing protein [Microbacterium sp. 2RAF4]|uniref:helix-turn-helix domain-containing protein n=1 Tax=Microbacterium sp. 2RAF4 TaxID=3232999 RepID=UPI003F9661E8
MSASPAGPALRVLREQSGLTAREVASRAGVSESYLSRVENGKVIAEPAWIGNVASAIAAALVETASAPQRMAVAS